MTSNRARWRAAAVAVAVACAAAPLARHCSLLSPRALFAQPPAVPPSAPSSACACSSASALDAGVGAFNGTGLHGQIEDCCCSYGAVDALVQELLRPVLTELVATPFFRYFKVRLRCDCPFWRDDSGECGSEHCAVCECPAEEVPLAWRPGGPPPPAPGSCDGGEAAPAPAPAPAVSASAAAAAAEAAASGAVPPGPRAASALRAESSVDRTLAGGGSLGGWRRAPPGGDGGGGDGGGDGGGESWSAEEEAAAAAGGAEAPVVVNLLLNPERYTGYGGAAAARVWQAVYGSPCLREGAAACAAAAAAAHADAPLPPPVPPPPPTPPGGASSAPESRLFYRLVSGLHASISAHIVGDWLGGGSGAAPGWAPHYGEWQRRLGDHPGRQQNLYATAAVALRALQRAAPALRAALAHAAPGGGDPHAARLLDALLSSPRLAQLCGRPFDERASLWAGAEGAARMQDLRAQFRNVTRLMDCVGCEKCRLWGKLQFLGLGTALKILSVPEGGGAPQPHLERAELIALVNTLHRLVESLEVNRRMAGDVEAGALLREAQQRATAQAAALPWHRAF